MNTAPDRDAPPGRTPVRRRLRAAAAELRHGTAPLPAAARRAVRVTAAACAGFYGCLYGLDLPVAATYALFAAVALAGLSRIPGTGRQRAAVIWRILPASWLLISLGTLLAVRTWAAVLGMLVIGFVLAFAAAAGPRPAGAAPGLQLLYILPCFPPYEPHTLGDRLGGATLGLLLLIAAEALLLPDPTGPGYPALIADAADLARRCTGELTAALCTLSADTREAAASAGQALRPSRTPEAERPASPGVRARALADAGCAARVLLARLLEMPPLTPPGDPGRPDATADADADSDTGSGAGAGTTADAGAELLAAVGAATDRAAAALRGGPPARPQDLERAMKHFRAGRAARIGGLPASGAGLAAAMSRQADLLEAADAALFLLRAVDVAVQGRHAPTGAPDGPFWYSHQPAVRLWWRRLSAHLSPRSVYFQNAVRLSVGLAAARAVAGLAGLPHGFWALLAALTLTRTTAVETRNGIRRALTGTLLGAAVAAALLVTVGHRTEVYAAALPAVMLATFTFGPVLGLGWAQGMFTVVVSLVFAQLAPAGWRLAEARVLDVLVGSLIGLGIGLLAWPRGARDELRRDVGLLLHAIGRTVATTTAAVAAGHRDPGPVDKGLQHVLIMAESTYVQYRSEPQPATASGMDWQAALIAGHHALRGARRLLGPAELPEGAAPGPEARAWLTRRADRLAHRFRTAGEQLGVGPTRATAPPPPPPPDPGPPQPPGHTSGRSTPPAALPVLFDTDAWLHGLAADLSRITPAFAHDPDHPAPA